MCGCELGLSQVGVGTAHHTVKDKAVVTESIVSDWRGRRCFDGTSERPSDRKKSVMRPYPDPEVTEWRKLLSGF